MRHSYRIIVLSLGLLTGLPVYATENNQLLTVIANGINRLVMHASGVWETTKEMLYQPTPEVEKTAAANSSQSLYANSQAHLEALLLEPSNGLKTHMDKIIHESLVADPETLSLQTFTVPGSDFKIPKDISIFNRQQINTSANPNNIAFNINSLIGPVAYRAYQTNNELINQGQLADTFIRLVTEADNPIKTLDLKNLNSIQYSRLAAEPKFLDYLLDMRRYIATRSIGINNFYHLYAKRQPRKDLAAKAGLPTDTPGYPNASPLQVEDYLAKKRIMNPNWYASIEAASPTTVLREMLYVMAEMRFELYQQRMQNELVLATLSALQLQSTSTEKADILKKRDEVRKLIYPEENL